MTIRDELKSCAHPNFKVLHVEVDIILFKDAKYFNVFLMRWMAWWFGYVGTYQSPLILHTSAITRSYQLILFLLSKLKAITIFVSLSKILLGK